MLQYITNTQSPVSVADQVRGVLDGGCRWIQISMRDATDEEITKVVNEVKPLCMERQAFLLLDGRVELAKTLDVGGVYLGKTDPLPSKARLELGPAAVVGIAAHTYDDILAVRSLDVDYIGIGPFRSDGDDALGLEGIRELSTRMLREEINIAHVAVGGVRKDDVVPLMEAGVNGVAVSAAIAFAKDIRKETEEFVKLLEPFMPK